jgi:hypothetical protein
MRRRLANAIQAANGNIVIARSGIIESTLKETRGGKPTLKSITLQWVLNRQRALKGPDRNRILAEKWNLDDVWYYLRRTEFIPQKINLTEDSRANVKGYIFEFCDLLGITRASLGIVAQGYATLYFQGNTYSITIDQLHGLKHLGCYVLIIEKEGIVEGLKRFADKYGVAIVTSHGFLTENAIDLANLINGISGANVALVTDFDISGILIALKLPGIKRIGIGKDTLRYLGYKTDLKSLQDFDETYTSNKPHEDAIQEIIDNSYRFRKLDSEYQRILTEDFTYLKTHRIEINAIREVAGNEKLWEYLMHELLTKLPPPNYNRSINISDLANITPDPVIELNEKVADQVADITSDSQCEYQAKLQYFEGFEEDDEDAKYQDRLEDFDGFDEDNELDVRCRNRALIRVEEYKEAITDDFNNQIDNDDNLGPALDRIDALANKLRKNRTTGTWQSGSENEEEDADD